MKRLPALLAAALAAGALVTVGGAPAHAATGCIVDYRVNSQWPGGFSTTVKLSNLDAPVPSWTLEFDFVEPGQRVTQGWSGTWVQSGQHVTVGSPSWAGPLGEATIGFNGAWTTANPPPVGFKLNGAPCGTPGSPNPQPPAVTLVSPLNGANLATVGAIHLEATASDPDGTIARVIFYRDGVSVFEDTLAPYAFDLTGTTIGNHVFQANAYDNSGLATPSNQATVTVWAPAPPAPGTVLRGLVVAGVELGCLLLRPDDAPTSGPQYLLLGGDRTVLVPGFRVEVTGRIRTDVVSICMQGNAAFEVTSARRI